MTDTDPIDAIVAHQARDLIVHAAAGGPSRLEVEACIRTAILLDRERRGEAANVAALIEAGDWLRREVVILASTESRKLMTDPAIEAWDAALAATDAPARPEGEG
jgi:hypothetical protein